MRSERESHKTYHDEGMERDSKRYESIRKEQDMTNISIYDDTAKILEEVAEKQGTTIAEIIDELIDYVDDLGQE